MALVAGHSWLQESPGSAYRRSTVPPEIFDHIIHYLHDDTESLQACTLVCRSWLPSSSYHLFRSESLSWPRCYHAGWKWSSRVCRCHPLNECSFLQELLAFCEASPRVRSRVRILNIACHWTVVDDEHGRKHTDDIRISLLELQQVLTLLPSLQELSIDQLSLQPPRKTLLPTCKSLRRLCLSRLSPVTACIYDPELLLDFFSLFETLSTLILDGPQCMQLKHIQPRSHRRHVDHLQIVNAGPVECCHYLQLVSVCINVRHIAAFNAPVAETSPQLRNEFPAFLRAAKNLRSLKLWPIVRLWDPIDQSLCAALQELIVVLLVSEWDPELPTGGAKTWPDVYHFLAGMPFPGVRQVTIEILVISTLRVFGNGDLTHRSNELGTNNPASLALREHFSNFDWSRLNLLSQAYPSVKVVWKLDRGSRFLREGDGLVEDVLRGLIPPRANVSVQAVID